jgi:hypothetical protein
VFRRLKVYTKSRCLIEETGRDPNHWTPKAKCAQTLRQMDRFWTNLRKERQHTEEAIRKENLSGKQTKALDFFKRLSYLKEEKNGKKNTLI